jgi:hypothetical protein
MKITNDIIADLWPLYLDGSASADTKALVDEVLRENPEWKESLQGDQITAGSFPLPDVQPDKETKMWNQIKMRIRQLRWLRLLALAFTGLAFGRIVSDTSWDYPPGPRRFVATAIVAGICWIAYFTAVTRLRRPGV